MSNFQLYYGSICLSDMIKQAKLPHSAFVKAGKEDKIFANVNIWINEEPDKFGNTVSIQLNSTQEMQKAEGKVYVGNAKKSERKEPEQLDEATASELPDDDDLPF